MKAKYTRTLWVTLLLLIAAGIAVFSLSYELDERYAALKSTTITDRNDIPIIVTPNGKEHYALHTTELPDEFTKLLLLKEDQYFYYHPGLNPVSIVRALWNKMTTGYAGGSSTITQQLVKILLDNEDNRTITNKLYELAYTVSLELTHSKETILSMYANSVYLGNQVQGFAPASLYYFNTPLPELSTSEQISILATLSSPSIRNPLRGENIAAAEALAERFDVTYSLFEEVDTEYTFTNTTSFELQSLGVRCTKSCSTTLDAKLQEKIRTLLAEGVTQAYDRDVRHGSVVVIKVPENEIIALVGSPDPYGLGNGLQINMALEPRPIGSTIKPFIYLKGFEKGLRPYTRVQDREYKYPIATGFPLYPKNYDGQYRGDVTLHAALSNSLNVPSVKVLEFVSLETFYDFLEIDLGFESVQAMDSYQYGIALGGLEMDLLTLTHFFTLFPNHGQLKPLTLSYHHGLAEINDSLPPQATITEMHAVADPSHVELVTKILSDRVAGVNQFGLRNNLTLSHKNYAVKTGTSRDFHDSWVVGYTPDYVVGVWLGNSENTPLKQVSGQTGAGTVWKGVMELLATTEYHSGATFSYENITQHPLNGSLEHGLANDDIAFHKKLLEQDRLILTPHHDDEYEFTNNMTIPLEASREVEWFVDGVRLEQSAQTSFSPTRAGIYTIEARDGDNRELLTIRVDQRE